jgi:hypothetical protein
MYRFPTLVVAHPKYICNVILSVHIMNQGFLATKLNEFKAKKINVGKLIKLHFNYRS